MDKLEEFLIQFTVKTFEELAFFVPVPEEEQENEDESCTITCVQFSGHSRGGLYIKFPDRALPVLAQNILAEDESPSQQQQHDALKEVANVICGNILPFLDGKEKQYRLNAPQIVDDILGTHKSDDFSHVQCRLAFDEAVVTLYWFYANNI